MEPETLNTENSEKLTKAADNAACADAPDKVDCDAATLAESKERLVSDERDAATLVQPNENLMKTPEGMKPPLPIPHAPRPGNFIRLQSNQGAVPKIPPPTITSQTIPPETGNQAELPTTVDQAGHTPTGHAVPLPEANAPRKPGRNHVIEEVAALNNVHGVQRLQIACAFIRHPREGEQVFSVNGSPLYRPELPVDEIFLKVPLPDDKVLVGRGAELSTEGLPPLPKETKEQLKMLRDQIDDIISCAKKDVARKDKEHERAPQQDKDHQQ